MDDEFEKDKLWVTGFVRSIADEELEKFCNKYGNAIYMYRPINKESVFLTYRNEEDAAKALDNFRRNRVHSNYAHKIVASKKMGSRFNSPNKISKNGAAGSTNSESLNSSTVESRENNRRVLHFSDEQPSNQHASNHQSNRTLGNKIKQDENSQPSNSNSVTFAPFNVVFRNGDDVIITHVKNASTVYLRPVSRDREYVELVKTISKLAKSSKPLSEIPQRVMVLAPYKGNYYRALINDTRKIPHGSDLEVLLVDIGITTNVAVHLLRTIPEEYTKIKITYSFIMRGLEEHDNNSHVTDCLMSYVGAKLQLECDGSAAQPRSHVKLIDPRTMQNINEFIKQATLTFNINDLTRQSASIGRNQALMVVDESKLKNGWNLLTFIDKKDSSEFYKQRNRIQTVGNNLQQFPPYLPMVEQLCLVNFEKYWSRGIFVKNHDDGCKAEVLLIDIGKSVEIEKINIRNITKELAQMPIISFIGTLKSFNKTIPDAKLDAIIEKFKMNEVICVKSISESAEIGIYSIET